MIEPVRIATTTRRVALLDVARSAALVAMVIYHFVFDLEAFGYLAPGTALTGGWAVFARAVASSFLVLVGVSLYLAHGQGIRWRGFWKRFAQLAAAAALITVGTRIALGPNFIFFGILHCIAVSSLLGLAALRLPASLLAVLSALVFALPRLVRFDAFGTAPLIWLGLGTRPVIAADFLPIFPWFSAVLAGIAIAKILTALDLWAPLARPSGPLIRWLGFPGRHSLVVYLVHQPILIGAMYVATQAVR